MVHDSVTSPSHYKLKGGGEVIDIIRDELTPEEFVGYCKGNMLKYLFRAGKKQNATDNEDVGKLIQYAKFWREVIPENSQLRLDMEGLSSETTD